LEAAEDGIVCGGRDGRSAAREFMRNGDADATLLASERALAHEDEVAHPQFFGIAHAMRGWALSRMGREEEGVAELERALADELRSSHIWAAIIGALLAEVHLRDGRPNAARDVLDHMVSLTKSMPACVFEPELLRIEAEWLRAKATLVDSCSGRSPPRRSTVLGP
jgi:hypothetical protein